MNAREFKAFLDRDQHCYHCGTTETLVPQHRANRGMGGSRARNVPSNIIVLCADINGRLESDAKLAQLGKESGWKLETWQDPRTSPVYDATSGEWFALDDYFRRLPVTALEL